MKKLVDDINDDLIDVEVYSGPGMAMDVLSVYEDKGNLLIDVEPRKVKSGRKENHIECGMPIGDCKCG